MKNILRTIITFGCLSITAISTTAFATDLLTNGMKSFSKGDFVSAQESLNLAYEKKPDDFRITYWLGQTHKAQGSYKSAKEYYLKTLALYPDFPPAIYVDIADVSIALEEYKDALRYINKAHDNGINTPISQQIKGVSLLKLRKHKKALSSFETVEQGNSSLTQEASFYSGLTHQAMRNIDAAEKSFQSVIAINNETDLGALAQQQIEFQSTPVQSQQKEFTIQTGVAFQVDTNPTLRPSNDSFAINNDIDGDRDQSTVFTLNAQWQPQISGPINFIGSYYYYGDWHNEFEYQDVSSHTLVLSPSYRASLISYSLPISFNYTGVDRKAYVREYTASPTISIPVKAQYLLQANVKASSQEFATTNSTTQSDRDNNTYGAAVNLYNFFYGQTGYWNIKAEVEDSDAKGSDWDNDKYKLTARTNYPFSEKLTGFASVSTSVRSFDNVHSFFSVKREDITYTGTIGASYEVIDGIDVTIRNTSQRNDSNTDLYDYKRNITNVGIKKTWGF